MGKTATHGTLSPFAFGPGLPVYEADLQVIVETQNYVVGESPTVFASMIADTDAWGLAGSKATHNVILAGSAGATTYYEFTAWIDPDLAEITCGATFYGLAGVDTVQVSWTVGLDAANVNYAAADNQTELTHTFDVASTGSGFRTMKMQINHTAGSLTDIRLHDWRIEGETIAAVDLPDPLDE